MSFIDNLFNILSIIDNFFWEYIGFSLILLVGIYFTFKTRGYQFRTLTKLRRYLKDLHASAKGEESGVHPFRLYFVSIGGMVGIGNIVWIVAVVTLGGPGGIFWLWVASFAGMLIKYSEIYLGVKYRVANGKKGYDGGPMYYLQAAFKGKFLSIAVCILLGIYGVEVSQFLIMTDSVSGTLGIDKNLVIAFFLVVVLYCAIGGITRISNLATVIMPPFLMLYIAACIWIIYLNSGEFFSMLPIIFKSAFTGHEAIGGFAGSSLFLAAQLGTSRAVYSGDIGIGYDSIVQSETKVKDAEKQARIAIFALFSDTFICTLTCLVVLVTGLWTAEGLQPLDYMQNILSSYFPNSDLLLTALIVIAGVSTTIGYLVIGLKCAKFLNKDWGEKIYLVYATFAYIVFSHVDQSKVILVMTISGGLLLLCNLCGIIKLRKEIKFH
jgi:alanine or glycine:cation symporter, AGCS family